MMVSFFLPSKQDTELSNEHERGQERTNKPTTQRTNKNKRTKAPPTKTKEQRHIQYERKKTAMDTSSFIILQTYSVKMTANSGNCAKRQCSQNWMLHDGFRSDPLTL
jgi:hypothetical protein